jgi:hypothetical protein
LILGLGIQPQLPSNGADLEASEGEAHSRELELQSPEISEASSPVDIEATHADLDSGNLSLGLHIYEDNNPSEYGPSP